MSSKKDSSLICVARGATRQGQRERRCETHAGDQIPWLGIQLLMVALCNQKGNIEVGTVFYLMKITVNNAAGVC